VSTQISSFGTNSLELTALEFKTQLLKKPIMFDLNSAKKKILQAQKESSRIDPSAKMQQNHTHYFIKICQKHTHSSFTESPSEGPIYTQRHKKLKEEVHHLLLRKLCGHDHPMYPQIHKLEILTITKEGWSCSKKLYMKIGNSIVLLLLSKTRIC
jgi:hypothetical protein